MKKRIVLPLLLICLLLAACQAEPATTAPKQAAQSTTKPQQTTTPQQTTVPPTDAPTNVLSNAEKITVGMTESDVYELLHVDGETLYNNVAVQKWELDNGKLLYIWFYPTEEADVSQPFDLDGNHYITGGYEICDQRQSWPGDYTPSAADVALIQEGMSWDQICEILGIGGKSIGSGLIVYKWLMDDGNEVFVWLTDGTASSVLIAPAGEESYMADIYSNAENVNNISVGMNYYEISDNMHGNDIAVCRDAEVVQYPLLIGGYVLVWYAEIDGIPTVCKVEIRSGALA